MTIVDKLDTLAARLKYMRKFRKMTQAELAEKSGVDRDVIAKIENGTTKRPRDLDKLATALECSQAWLQYGHEELEQLTKDDLDFLFAWKELGESHRLALRDAVLAMKATLPALPPPQEDGEDKKN